MLEKSIRRLWKVSFQELEAHQLFNGHCRVSGYQNNRLGLWVQKQRTNYRLGKLDNDKIEMLESIGFEWTVQKKHKQPCKPVSSTMYDKLFNEMIPKYKLFVKQNGHYAVPQDYKVDGMALGRWVNNRRNEKKMGKMKPERETQLNEIGFVWEVDQKKNRQPTNSTTDLGLKQSPTTSTGTGTESTLATGLSIAGEDDGNNKSIHAIEELTDDVGCKDATSSTVAITDHQETSPPTKSSNILMLGMAYGSTATISDEELKKIKKKLTNKESPQQQKSAIRDLGKIIKCKNVLRDTVRLLLTEEVYDGVNAYALSLQENELIDTNKNIIGDFTSHRLLRKLRELGVTFDEMILDYYWIPEGSWQMKWWNGLLKNIRMIQNNGHLSTKARIYLPFTVFLLEDIYSESKNDLLDLFNIRFIEEKDLTQIKLWTASRYLNSNVHYEELGKVLEQEETSCNIDKKQVNAHRDSSKNTKEDLDAFCRSINNFGNIRFICLEVLENGEKGNIHGIIDKKALYDNHTAPQEAGKKEYNLETDNLQSGGRRPRRLQQKGKKVVKKR